MTFNIKIGSDLIHTKYKYSHFGAQNFPRTFRKRLSSLLETDHVRGQISYPSIFSPQMPGRYCLYNQEHSSGEFTTKSPN